MAVQLNPYLNFRDTARTAIEFYHSVFGGDLSLMTYAELPMSDDPAEKDKVAHAQLTADNGMMLMAADLPNSMPYNPGNNYSVSLSGDDEATLRGYWDKLSEGATITAPLAKAPWGDTFGMCIDKFGVTWLVNIAADAG